MANLEQFACKKCNKRFMIQSSLTRHIKNVHENPNLSFPCDQCDKVLALHSSLLRHKKSVHGDEGQYSCQECDFLGLRLVSNFCCTICKEML